MRRLVVLEAGSGVRACHNIATDITSITRSDPSRRLLVWEAGFTQQESLISQSIAVVEVCGLRIEVEADPGSGPMDRFRICTGRWAMHLSR